MKSSHSPAGKSINADPTPEELSALLGPLESARTNPPIERDLWLAISRKFQFWASGLGNAASD